MTTKQVTFSQYIKHRLNASQSPVQATNLAGFLSIGLGEMGPTNYGSQRGSAKLMFGVAATEKAKETSSNKYEETPTSQDLACR